MACCRRPKESRTIIWGRKRGRKNPINTSPSTGITFNIHRYRGHSVLGYSIKLLSSRVWGTKPTKTLVYFSSDSLSFFGSLFFSIVSSSIHSIMMFFFFCHFLCCVSTAHIGLYIVFQPRYCILRLDPKRKRRKQYVVVVSLVAAVYSFFYVIYKRLQDDIRSEKSDRR